MSTDPKALESGCRRHRNTLESHTSVETILDHAMSSDPLKERTSQHMSRDMIPCATLIEIRNENRHTHPVFAMMIGHIQKKHAHIPHDRSGTNRIRTAYHRMKSAEFPSRKGVLHPDIVRISQLRLCQVDARTREPCSWNTRARACDRNRHFR